MTYALTVTGKNGNEKELTVAADGTLLSLEMALAETPSVVQTAIKAQLGANHLELVQKTLEEGQFVYEVEATRKDGSEASFAVSEEGKLVSLQVSLAEVPAAVRTVIQSRLGHAKLEGIYRTFEDGDISYYIEETREGKLRGFSVATDGTLESVQFFLSETPATVQKTIRERLAGATLVRIDQTFEKRMGVFPFEVEGRKNGKPLNFSVGPHGRFLGLD